MYLHPVAHEINTRTDAAPVNVRPYRLPKKHKLEVNRQIKEMLQSEIIRTSVSQWNAPLLVVPKKADASGKPKLRVVVDFQKLNNITIGNSFPLPNITEILDQLGSWAKYFTTWRRDIIKSRWLSKIRENRILNTLWALRIQSNAVRIEKCARHVPTPNELSPNRDARTQMSSLFRRHRNIRSKPGGPQQEIQRSVAKTSEK